MSEDRRLGTTFEDRAVVAAPSATTLPPRLTFDLGERPLSPHEQHGFADDLRDLGHGPAVWQVLDATLATGTRSSRPLLLRAYDGDRLVGAALIVECHRMGRCISRSPLLAGAIDTVPLPSFAWCRLSAGIDGWTNPGFVRGIDRGRFVDAAVDYLLTKYPLGLVHDRAAPHLAAPVASVPNLDYGLVDLAVAGDPEYFLERHANLRRKLRKFRNKGGTLERVEGAMPEAEARQATRWLRELDPELHLAFQDVYPDMASRILGLRDAPTVHVLARLDGALVGYQSFLRSGERLVCLSGLFDRARPSTYHAYENIILESVRYGAEHGLRRIDYGPVVNPTKAKFMTHYARASLHYVSRNAALRRAAGWLLHHSVMSPKRLAPFIGLGPAWPDAY